MTKYSETEVVGKTEAVAKVYLEGIGMKLRVIQKDGKEMPGTAEVRSNRVNVAVKDGIVTQVFDIG